jgi:CheY-like chemotaxis protein
MVGDGLMAVEAFKAARFDVVLLDMQMPELDGPDAARAIRAVEAQTGRQRTPIVALTANALPHHVAACMVAGMDGHVAKPLQPQALYETLAEVLASGPDGVRTAAA